MSSAIASVQDIGVPEVQASFRQVDETGLRSLEELLEAHAEHYVEIGELFSQFDTWFDGKILSRFPIPEDRLLFLRQHLPVVAGHCAALDLQVTQNLVIDFSTRYRDVTPTWDASLDFLKCMRETFKAELRTCVFLHVNRERVRYYTRLLGTRPKCGFEVEQFITATKTFRSAHREVIEAGQCMACERFTAAVYHLMRIAELGLVSLATTLNVMPKNPSWEGIIGAINGELIRISSAATKPVGWKENETFYRQALGWIGDIKTGWRNPVSHMPRIYEEPEARGIFSATRNLLQDLSKHGIAETAMPEAIRPPRDMIKSKQSTIPDPPQRQLIAHRA